jgi:NitT/TauT family transport system ATP-binding protein
MPPPAIRKYDRCIVVASLVGSDTALRFQSIGKTFPDGTEAIASVTLSVAPGEFVAVVGPSGCGKSTLLRIASGLTPATSGAVLVDVPRESIGYVFQDPTLMPWRTVKDNVGVLLELHDVDKHVRASRVQEAINLVGLSGFEGHYPRALSGGMRMRVSLARSLTMRPRLFLFDEPFGALDEISRQRLNGELQQLFVGEQFAGVFITHSVVEAVYLSTRVAVMSARPGRLVRQFDIPFAYPRSPDLRFDAHFGELAGEVSQALSRAV